MVLAWLLRSSRLHRRPAWLWRLAVRAAPLAVAVLVGLGAAFGAVAPWLESDGNAEVWTFAYIPVLASVMVGLIVWLALFTASPRRAPGRVAVPTEAASGTKTPRPRG